MGLYSLVCRSSAVSSILSASPHRLQTHLARARAIWVALAATLVLSACGIFSGKEDDPTVGWSAGKLYAEAQNEISSGNWEAAVKLLQSLQSRYPFGRIGQQAQMELAYAHYRDNDPALARAAAERFIKQYPNHPNVDYLYYLKGLISFTDNLGLLSSLSRQDLSERDPKSLRESFDSFKELIARFPESNYAADAVLRMRYLVNSMARHEIHVADYYLRRGAYLAAANRAQGVLRNYQQDPAVEAALYIMVRAYDALRLTDLRDDAKRVLDKNFPNSELPTKGLSRPRPPWWQIW